MPLALADLESLLRARKLDRTLTTALPPSAAAGDDDAVVAPTRIRPLDARLAGGLPRGQLCELVGPRSSGRTSVCLQLLAAATARGELVALVDALDGLDVASAVAAGVDLARLLWVRGHVVSNPPRGALMNSNTRALDGALKALALVLQAGNFGVVVFDIVDAPRDAVRSLPFTTWLRVQRMIEGSQTTCVIVANEPVARSSSGLTLLFGGPPASGPQPPASRFNGRLFDGLDVDARVVRAKSIGSHVCVSFPTTAA
jgi:hypothetical protein